MDRQAPDAQERPDAQALRQAGLQRPLSYFVHAHKGLPAVVIGGGVSRSEGLRRAPPADAAIYISANAHGLTHWSCRYIMCLDMIEPKLAPFGVPIASPRRFGQIRLFAQRFNQSGMMGAYLAWAFGCSPILLAGMDCYQGGTYEGDPTAKSSGNSSPLHTHLNNWSRLRDFLGADVRALGGTLAERGIFPRHDSTPAGRSAPATRVYREVGGTVVQFRRECKMAPVAFGAGDTAEISASEAQRHKQSLTVLGQVADNPELLKGTVPARRFRVNNNNRGATT